MTCIAGIAHDGKVFIGGDSAGVAGLDLDVVKLPKVFVNGDFVIGYTSSFRMGQVLQFAFTPPKRHPDRDVMHFMVTDFIDAVRNAFKGYGFAKKEMEVESGGFFLVGHSGRLFVICSDYQVFEPTCGYSAVGCGESFAKGVFFATQGGAAEQRIDLALKAAEAHSAGVRGPFHVVSI